MHFLERLHSSRLSDSGLPLILYVVSKLKASCQLTLHNSRAEGSLLAWTAQFLRERLVSLKDCAFH